MFVTVFVVLVSFSGGGTVVGWSLGRLFPTNFTFIRFMVEIFGFTTKCHKRAFSQIAPAQKGAKMLRKAFERGRGHFFAGDRGTNSGPFC